MSSTSTILAELHTHSIASDGQYTPAQVAAFCASHSVKLWALTDHDTLDGCAAAASAAAAHGIAFLPGVEISARAGCSIHVLGYGLDPQDSALSDFFAQRKHLRATRMTRMVEAAQRAGLGVTQEDVLRLARGGAMARPHLARALVERGHAGSVKDAFDRYLAEGKALYVPSPHVSVPQAIALIHEHGGVAVLAHPAYYEHDKEIEGWVSEHGLDGIEVSHPSHSAQDVARYEALASRLGVLQTASSDFHGEAVAPERKLGVTRVARERVEALLERVARAPLALM